jgi:hypothetical protein
VPPINGPISKTGPAPIYLAGGRYLINYMDWGFIYLDSGALTSNYIHVLGKCAIPQLSPASNLWTALDCNGITDASQDPVTGTVVINSMNGQCAALHVGSCSGTFFPKKYAFGFAPGTWVYDKTWNTQVLTAPNTTGPDSQGRKWQLSCTAPSPNPTNCIWSVLGTGPTPTAAPTHPGQPSPTRTSVAPPTPPAPTATPCNLPPWGQPGPFGRCYDCQGNVVGDQPCGPKTATPVSTVTPVRTATRSATCPPCPCLTPTSRPTVGFRTPIP